MSWWSFKPYVSVAARREKAAREVKKLQKKGRSILPVHIEGTAIARTFWGKAWCDNLESYSDYDNRLPRGRTYVRNGSVCDLQIERGRVTALVCGSELYRIEIGIKALSAQSWAAVKQQCAGQIGTVIELLQGKLSASVMRIITRRDGGLFPAPQEIDLDCSCPDWADMCKHVAAALYGVGARLDERPELLFVLRQVDHLELIGQAGDVGALTKRGGAAKTIAASELSDVFGIDLQTGAGDTDSSAAAAPVVETSEPAGNSARTAAPKRSKRTPAATTPAQDKGRTHKQATSRAKTPATRPSAGSSRRTSPAAEVVGKGSRSR